MVEAELARLPGRALRGPGARVVGMLAERPRSEAMQALLQQSHWHEENKEDHARTRGTVEKAAKAVLDAQVAIHATVEDIASSLGVGMDKKRRKTFV